MSLTQEDMVNIFTQGVTTWNQVNSAYPTKTITLIMVADPDVSSIFLSALQLTSVTFTTGYVSPSPLLPLPPTSDVSPIFPHWNCRLFLFFLLLLFSFSLLLLLLLLLPPSPSPSPSFSFSSPSPSPSPSPSFLPYY